MTNRTRSATLLGAACLVAVAGCGSDPKPKVLPSLSSTPSTTATSTTSPGSVEAEVEAAVRHYFDVATEAANTGHTAELESLSAPGCGCRELVRSIQTAHQNGKSVGVRFIVKDIHIHDAREKAAGATVRIEVPSYRDVDLRGNTIRTYASGETTEDLSLVKKGQNWIVTNGIRLSE